MRWSLRHVINLSHLHLIEYASPSRAQQTRGERSNQAKGGRPSLPVNPSRQCSLTASAGLSARLDRRSRTPSAFTAPAGSPAVGAWFRCFFVLCMWQVACWWHGLSTLAHGIPLACWQCWALSHQHHALRTLSARGTIRRTFGAVLVLPALPRRGSHRHDTLSPLCFPPFSGNLAGFESAPDAISYRVLSSRLCSTCCPSCSLPAFVPAAGADLELMSVPSAVAADDSRDTAILISKMKHIHFFLLFSCVLLWACSLGPNANNANEIDRAHLMKSKAQNSTGILMKRLLRIGLERCNSSRCFLRAVIYDLRQYLVEQTELNIRPSTMRSPTLRRSGISVSNWVGCAIVRLGCEIYARNRVQSNCTGGIPCSGLLQLVYAIAT